MTATSVNQLASSPGRLSVAVTGGASGIGLAITRQFASQGHMVAVLDVNAETGPQVVADVAKEFPDASLSFKWCDVSSWENQYAMLDQAYREHGNRIDVVIANAGISEQGAGALDCLPREFPQKPQLRMQDINLNGVIYSESCPYLSKGRLGLTKGNNNHRCWACGALHAEERDGESSAFFQRLHCLHGISRCHLSFSSVPSLRGFQGRRGGIREVHGREAPRESHSNQCSSARRHRYVYVLFCPKQPDDPL